MMPCVRMSRRRGPLWRMGNLFCYFSYCHVTVLEVAEALGVRHRAGSVLEVLAQ